MTPAVTLWWWIFLIVALIVTIADVYLLALVVHLCRQIRALSAFTLTAAGGIAANTKAGDALGQTVQLVTALVNKTTGLDPLTASVVGKLTGARS